MERRPHRRSRARRIILGVVALGLVGVVLGRSPIAVLAAGLSLKTDGLIAERRPDPHYEQLFPRYVELCATSQWRKPIGGGGNPFGHGLIYIKGACKAEDAAFPQLRRCAREATSVDDPEHGAGISVGRFFRNVDWVAVPACEFFYRGNLEPGETLTQERLDETVGAAIAAGVFDGVELHDGRGGEWTRGLEAFVGQHSAGTDFALAYARNVFRARVPVTEGQVDEMIAFLNDKNTEYATREAEHDWNLFWDNCVHTIRNALAAANIWEPIGVWDVHIRSIFNMAVPANEFVNLAILGAEGPLDDYREIQDTGPSRDTLHEFGWLPTRHGALVKYLPAHSENALFDPSFRLFAVQSLISMGAAAKTLRLMSDPRHVDLESNLAAFVEEYERIEASHGTRREPLDSVRGDPYRRVARLHLDYVRRERDDAARLLERLRDLKAADGVEERASK